MRFLKLIFIFSIIIHLSYGYKFKKQVLKKFKLKTTEKLNPACNNFSYILQNVDHFNFNPDNSFKYKQRYIISDQYVPTNSLNNPIFFYTGNEGDIKWFCDNTGFVWQIASKFQALVIFAEHRYYGESLPFGNNSFKNPQISYLTSEQALADYAYLINYIKSNQTKFESSPVIAFGGSYGGMLSAWFRMKYPNVIAGSIAASAPVWQFVTECGSFLKIVTDTFRKSDPKCPDIIGSSWDIINQFSKTEQGLNQLTSIFKLCEPLKNGQDLKDWLNDLYGNIAMANYPYEANFLSPLPAWPVKVMCNNITSLGFQNDPAKLLESIYKGANVYVNYTGESKCIDIGSSTPFDIDMISWTYQTCTEFVFPMCSNGKTDMFEPDEWNFNSYSQDCFKQFGTLPRQEWPVVNYGASYKDIKSHSNIIFSNGDLDPWTSGGVLQNVNPTVPAILIENGAHHLDLRESNPSDPESVILARLVEIDYIDVWIRNYYTKLGNKYFRMD